MVLKIRQNLAMLPARV